MKPTFTATYPKDDSAPETNEDRVGCDRLRDVYCMSDGASESYDSGNWAQILVAKCIRSGSIGWPWLLEAMETYRDSVNHDELTWSQQAAFDRGSFATLLAVRLIDRGRVIKVTSIGDSLCVLCDGDRFRSSFRYRQTHEFSARPQLLATVLDLNRSVRSSLKEERFTRTWSSVRLRRPALLLMTDALGEWLLKDRNRRCGPLLRLRHQHQFASLVRSERSANRLRTDDTTLLVLR